MDKLDLYKFVNDNNLEYHYQGMNNEGELYLIINNDLLDKWNKLLGQSITDEYGLNCTMKDGYIAFEMKYICEYYDIETTDIFEFKED